jgi:hypothetical protein
MKTTQKILVLITLLILAALACQLTNQANFNSSEQFVKGSGTVVSEPRPVSGFTKVELAGIGELEVTLGDQEALTITAEDNLLPLITTEVIGNTLKIGIVEGKMPSPTHPISYDLTVRSLDAIAIPGLGNVHVPVLKADRLQVDIPGAGNLVIDDLQADSLRVNQPGAGSLKIGGGQVPDVEITIPGAGNFEAPDLQTARAVVTIPGLGSATLRVSDTLTATIPGAGSVRYYGNPTVSKNISGLGQVEKLGD